MTLTPCDDATVINWITQATNVPATDGTVARLVPVGFEAYAQVLHAIHLEPDVETLRHVEFAGVVSASRAATEVILAKLGGGLPPGATISRSRSGGSRRGRRGKRVRWRELAGVLGRELAVPVSFERDLWDAFSGDWPDQLDGPVEGSLTFEECLTMALALKPFSQAEITYWYGWANTKDYQGLCLSGLVSDMDSLLELNAVSGSPEYWWPSDRSWVVHTNLDLTYTMVAGSHALIDTLVRNPELEGIELRSDSRLWPPTDHLRQPYSPTPPASPSSAP